VSIRDALDISYNTARRDLDRLVEAGIIKKLQVEGRKKKYYAPEIMECAFEELPDDNSDNRGAPTNQG
jgi:Fe2+ or Zn2+ uptake regulation protein